MDLYSSESDPFDQDRVAMAKTLASLVGWQVLRRILVDFQDAGDDPQYSRREVHQATGMILAQLNTSASDAKLLLHAHAYASGRSVMDVAEDVVARRIDFSGDAPA